MINRYTTEIVGISGPIRAGKTTVSDYISNKYGYTRITNSEILSSILNKLDTPVTRESLRKLGESMLSILGNDILAKSLADRTNDFPIVVDGIRYLDEIKYYRSKVNFYLISVSADENLRLNRAMLSNSNKDNFNTIEEFKTLSTSRSELEIYSIKEESDIIIENNSSLNKLYRDIDILFDK
jgi:dephospho-CoA kinase